MREDSENSKEMTMADYSVLCENQQIEIGKAGENLARSCTIDYSAWLKEYGEGDLRIRAIRSGDAEPYPVTNVTTENGVATWTFTDADTAVKGYGEVQILYYVEDVLAKSRVWRTYTHRSLSTSSEEVPDPYQDWLSEVERIGSQIEEDAESASDSATRAAGSASEAAESALSATRSESSAQEYASAASSSAESAESSATAASRSATEASNYEYYSEQYMNEAKSAKFGAESARTGAENAKAAAQASATAAAQSAEQAEEAAESIEESADLVQKLMDNQIKDTATGTIASFPDGADMPMVSLVADIDPIQDTSGGAPSPSNICPISGCDSVDVSVAGKNLIPFPYDGSTVSQSGITVTPNSDGSFVLNGTATATVYLWLVDKTNNIPSWVKPNTTYTVSCGNGQFNNAPRAQMILYGSPTFAITESTRTTPSDLSVYTHFAVFVQIGNGSTYTNKTIYPQIEVGSSATAFEPHTSDTHTTTLPQTVYGGTLDVVSGVLTVDRAMVDLGTLTWSKYNATAPGTDTRYIWGSTSLTGQAPDTPLSSHYVGVTPSTSNAQAWTKGDNAVSFLSGGDKRLYVRDDAHIDDTPADFKAYLSGVQLCYTLATPTTIQCDPQQIQTLQGQNNVWADSGDVTVEYIADTKLYIKKVMGAIG